MKLYYECGFVLLNRLEPKLLHLYMICRIRAENSRCYHCDKEDRLQHTVARIFYARYSDVIMGAMASQITGITIVYSTVYSGADQRKHHSSASLAFCAGNSPVTDEFHAQLASNAGNVSIGWRHHVLMQIVIVQLKSLRKTWKCLLLLLSYVDPAWDHAGYLNSFLVEAGSGHHARSQGISSQGIGLALPEYSVLSTSDPFY